MKFSIITINLNNKVGLEKTIKSVLSQTFKDYEFIIIDGNSTDGSKDVIEKYQSFISYSVSEPDGGIYEAMNKGTSVAQGDYCNFLNSGDCYHDSTVLEHISKMDQRADVLTGCHDLSFGRNAGEHGVTMLDLFRWSYNHQESFIKRELCIKYPYDVKYRLAADRKFFIEAFVKHNCTLSFTKKLIIDVEPGGASSRHLDECEREILQILHEFLPPRIFKDYVRFAKCDSSILEVLPLLSNTIGLQSLVYKFAKLLLAVRNNRLYRFVFRKEILESRRYFFDNDVSMGN